MISTTVENFDVTLFMKNRECYFVGFVPIQERWLLESINIF